MTELTVNEKRLLLESRLKALLVDLYGHELNKQLAIATNDEKGIEKADEAINIIQGTVNLYQQELAFLPVIDAPN